MSDDFVVRSLVLIFFKEIGSSGKCDLCDIFFYLISSHTKTGINEFQGFFFRIDNDFDFFLIIIRESIFTHHFQLLQLGNCITAVGNQLAEKNIVVRIKPLFYDWKNVFAVNGKASCFFAH